ncbi:hypothetical protein SPBR_04027 [Sporothrix brasiliensis 5110]|uniref:FHA domain-containing protein n=1 Tax=Sporothrix brasiliensis 5110 TaxID=1398154 RepID=A0A0C2FQY9_9PEZI|nr:uncharacterized protein SPBR_04027 [Sporothrix brasiliensis 5110]KIH93448.1 hypothetical protein SPBR_04027 [Sporothrix brasiliensis 5110]
MGSDGSEHGEPSLHLDIRGDNERRDHDTEVNETAEDQDHGRLVDGNDTGGATRHIIIATGNASQRTLGKKSTGHGRDEDDDQWGQQLHDFDDSADNGGSEANRERKATQSAKQSGPLPDQASSFAMAEGGEIPKPPKEQPNWGTTGTLAAASNAVAQDDGSVITLKYHEPPEARKPSPRDQWKLFVFKDDAIVDTIDLGTRSCWLAGRDSAVVDLLAAHPSISKQHAVLQFRFVEKRNEFGDRIGRVKPYLLDLASANGTKLNHEEVATQRYVELQDKDMVQFGHTDTGYLFPFQESTNLGSSSQGSVNLDVSRFEVTPVFTHPDAHVDIILVHGLNGQPKRTWTAKNGLYWPAELLPETLKKSPANILVYGYNADVYGRGTESSPSDNFIYQHAMTLVSHLTAFRQNRGTSNNPLIWVTHSLGGILVKRALLYSNDLRDADHEASRSIYVSTYGIIFLGTPHTGSGLAFWGRVLQGMGSAAPKKFFDTEPVLIKSLKRNNERLQEINNHFLDIYQRFKIQMVHENHKTDLKGTKAFVVDVDSASPQLPGVTYYGIEADHSNICKFDGANAPGYQTMVTSIQEWVIEAPPVIEIRWTVEHEDRVARARREIEERRLTATIRARSKSNADTDLIEGIPDLLSLRAVMAKVDSTTILSPGELVESPITSIPLASAAATSPMPLLPPPVSSTTSGTSTVKQDPLFLHPEKFRPNSYFVGRKRELEELHRKLTDSAKRAEGTSAVVIQSLPGGGKTHLARQYVFQHRDDYPGGIYWIRAKSIAEMEQFFWTIAKNEALRNIVEKTLEKKPSSSSDSQKELCDPHNIVNIVRAWFSSFDQWLVVFDGIIFNTPGIERFIPDAKNTSIIYTSIQSDVSGRYEFDNPQIMKLDMLSPEDARDLLLTEMERKKPWREGERAQALEIVKRMGCLPLMVHAAARHIKTTREPLSKYLRTLQNRIWASDLPAYYNVWDELKSRGAYPSLNLMYILAFLGGRVPVGFLNLVH